MQKYRGPHDQNFIVSRIFCIAMTCQQVQKTPEKFLNVNFLKSSKKIIILRIYNCQEFCAFNTRRWPTNAYDVIAQTFVRNLISYISYFWLKERNFAANESHERMPVYVTPTSLYENL